MRMMKLALFALAALLLGSASASAITVKKRIEAPGLPPQIWEHAGGFVRSKPGIPPSRIAWRGRKAMSSSAC